MIEGDLGIDLQSIRDQLKTISDVLDPGAPLGGFLGVEGWTSATAAIENGNGIVPFAYVSTARQNADPNRLSSGGFAQNVPAYISVLYQLGAYRADEDGVDPVERCWKAIVKSLVGFKPDGATRALRFVSQAIRQEGEGFVWGEVVVFTTWDLRGTDG